MEEENKKKIVALKDLGPCLPIGIKSASGSYGKSIGLRAWKLKHEKMLSAAKEKAKKLTAAQYANIVLRTMCTELGDVSLEGLSEKDAKQTIGQMYMGDVLYAYVWLRYQAIGHVMESKLKCGSCGHDFVFPADLETLDVKTVDKVEDAYWEYELQDPIEIRGKRLAKMVFGPAKWGALEAMSPGQLNEGAMKEMLIRASFVENPEDKSFFFSMGDLDEMSKRDLEKISDKFDDNHIGPDMSLETSCPACNYEFKVAINWAADDFFGGSSR